MGDMYLAMIANTDALDAASACLTEMRKKPERSKEVPGKKISFWWQATCFISEAFFHWVRHFRQGYFAFPEFRDLHRSAVNSALVISGMTASRLLAEVFGHDGIALFWLDKLWKSGHWGKSENLQPITRGDPQIANVICSSGRAPFGVYRDPLKALTPLP